MSKKSSTRIARIAADAVSYARHGRDQKAWESLLEAWELAAGGLLQAPPSSAKYLALMADFEARHYRPRRAADLSRRAIGCLSDQKGAPERELAADLDTLATVLDQLESSLIHGSGCALSTEDLVLVLGYRRLAVEYRLEGRTEKAMPLLRRSVELLQRQGPWPHPGVVALWVDLAETCRFLGRNVDAEAWYLEALELLAASGECQALSAELVGGLAELHSAQGDHSEARQAAREALSCYRRVLGENHPGLSVSMLRLADIERVAGDWEAAEPLLTRAVAIYSECLGNSHLASARSLGDFAAIYGRLFLALAHVYRLRGQLVAAEAAFHRAWKIIVAASGKDHCDAARIANDLGTLFHENRRLPAARALYEHAADVLRRDPGHTFEDLGGCLNNLALFWQQQGRVVRASALRRENRALRHQALGDGHSARTRSD